PSLTSLHARVHPSPPLFPYTTLFRSPQLASAALLEDPGVAVGVAEVSERAVVAALGIRAWYPRPRIEMPDLADVHPSLDEFGARDRKSTRLNSSHVSISYAVFCLKKK